MKLNLIQLHKNEKIVEDKYYESKILVGMTKTQFWRQNFRVMTLKNFHISWAGEIPVQHSSQIDFIELWQVWDFTTA